MTSASQPPEQPPFSLAERKRPQRLSAWLPHGWIATRRRRRVFFVALAAPGFTAIFATPLHQTLWLLVLGLLLLAGAWLFRRRTEPLFARAEQAALSPATRPHTRGSKDPPTHA
jgi:LPXTG-motif cell wall-anchored protein